MAHCEEKFETAWFGLNPMRQMSAALETAFASIDSNQDGKISFEEMKQVRLVRKQ